jgi:hypothetical protein
MNVEPSSGLFELKFAEERTRQAAPRVGLLVLLKTFPQLGYFVKVADVPDSGLLLRCSRLVANTPSSNHRRISGDSSLSTAI